MDAELENESGQSVLEFLFMLPVMVGLVVLMVRINTAIQISIVDQQYARAQATWLTFNSAVYPQIALRYSDLVAKNYNQMLLGVADNVTPADGSPYVPKASVEDIARTLASSSSANNDPQTEPNPDQGGTRAFVRVRDTVSLCSQPTVIQVNGQFLPILEMTGLNTADPQGVKFNLPEDAKFDYCRSAVIQ